MPNSNSPADPRPPPRTSTRFWPIATKSRPLPSAGCRGLRDCNQHRATASTGAAMAVRPCRGCRQRGKASGRGDGCVRRMVGYWAAATARRRTWVPFGVDGIACRFAGLRARATGKTTTDFDGNSPTAAALGPEKRLSRARAEGAVPAPPGIRAGGRVWCPQRPFPGSANDFEAE